jgi:hypothetical protein
MTFVAKDFFWKLILPVDSAIPGSADNGFCFFKMPPGLELCG